MTQLEDIPSPCSWTDNLSTDILCPLVNTSGPWTDTPLAFLTASAAILLVLTLISLTFAVSPSNQSNSSLDRDLPEAFPCKDGGRRWMEEREGGARREFGGCGAEFKVAESAAGTAAGKSASGSREKAVENPGGREGRSGMGKFRTNSKSLLVDVEE